MSISIFATPFVAYDNGRTPVRQVTDRHAEGTLCPAMLKTFRFRLGPWMVF